MANPLPYSYTTFQQVEAYLLEKVGTFVNTLTGLEVFLTNKPWPSTTDPLIGIRVLSYGDSGWGDWSVDNTTDYGTTTINILPVIEFFAVRGSPMAALTTVRMALRGMREYKYENLWQYGIGVLSLTDIMQHDSVLDGTETEYRAKMLANMSLSVSLQELTTLTPVETINITQTSQSSTDASEDSQAISIESSDTDTFFTDPTSTVRYPGITSV